MKPANTTPDHDALAQLHWSLTECHRLVGLAHETGRHLFRGVFRSERIPRRGCYEVAVYFYGRRPQMAIRKRLAAGECPVDFHKQVMD